MTGERPEGGTPPAAGASLPGAGEPPRADRSRDGPSAEPPRADPWADGPLAGGRRPPSGAPSPPAKPPGFSRWGWLVGVVVVAVMVYAIINAARTEGPGSRGVPAGEPLPPFAAPLATSDLEGDANVATRPDSGGEGVRPACAVRGPRILNSCQLVERDPVALVFFTPGNDICERQLDVVQDTRAGADPVQLAAVAIRGDREDLRRTIASRGWRFPIGYDADGAVANRYGIAVCPTTVLARRGGRVVESVVGELDGRDLARRLARLRGPGG